MPWKLSVQKSWKTAPPTHFENIPSGLKTIPMKYLAGTAGVGRAHGRYSERAEEYGTITGQLPAYRRELHLPFLRHVRLISYHQLLSNGCLTCTIPRVFSRFVTLSIFLLDRPIRKSKTATNKKKHITTNRKKAAQQHSLHQQPSLLYCCTQLSSVPHSSSSHHNTIVRTVSTIICRKSYYWRPLQQSWLQLQPSLVASPMICGSYNIFSFPCFDTLDNIDVYR